jgi:drug/metabolite transporter (DMT)-like permease
MLRSLVQRLNAHPRMTAFLGAMAIAFSGVLYEFSKTSPETASFYRAFWGLPILALAAYVERTAGKRGAMDRRSVGIALFAGVLFAGDLIFWHHTIELVGAGLATVLGNLQVVVVAIAAWLLFGERPSTRVLVALPIILSGVAFIAGVFGGLGGQTYGSNPQLGVFLGFLCALSYAGYLLTIRRISGRRTAGPVAVSTASTAIVSLLIGIALGTMDLTPGTESMFWLILLGVTAQSIGYLCISISLPRLPAVVTSIILLAQPVVSMGLAIVILGETPSPGQLFGVLCVIGGIALATVPLTKLRRRPAKQASAPAVGPG